MSNIIAFPDSRAITEPHESFLDETRILAYAERYAQQPDRIMEMSNRLKLAAKAAEILHMLIEDMKKELDS